MILFRFILLVFDFVCLSLLIYDWCYFCVFSWFWFVFGCSVALVCLDFVTFQLWCVECFLSICVLIGLFWINFVVLFVCGFLLMFLFIWLLYWVDYLNNLIVCVWCFAWLCVGLVGIDLVYRFLVASMRFWFYFLWTLFWVWFVRI